MRCSNASYFSETLKIFMAKQAISKPLAAAPASPNASRPATRSLPRGSLPPSDPAEVAEVKDSEFVDPSPALVQDNDRSVEQTADPRQADEKTYGKASTPAAEAESTPTPAPVAEPKRPSPKRGIPSDDAKSEAPEPKKKKAEHPLYLMPSFLSDEHALDAAHPVPSWNPSGWDKRCKRGAAYKGRSEASGNSRRIVSLLRVIRAKAQKLGFLKIAIPDRFIKNNLAKLNTVEGDEILATMWAQEYDKASIEQLYLALVPDVLRLSQVGSASKHTLIEELVACKAPFMFFDYMQILADDMQRDAYTQQTTHEEAVASMLQSYIFCADQQFERSIKGFEADADDAEAAAAAEEDRRQKEIYVADPDPTLEDESMFDSEDCTEPGLTPHDIEDGEQSIPDAQKAGHWAMPPPPARPESVPPLKAPIPSSKSTSGAPLVPGRRPCKSHEDRRGARCRLPTPRWSMKSEMVKQTIAKA